MVSINGSSLVIEYRGTLAMRHLAAAREIINKIVPTWGNFMDDFMRDIRRTGYLPNSLHKQLTTIYNRYAVNLEAIGIPAKEIVAQSIMLEDFGKWSSSRYRADRVKGMVEFLEPQEFDKRLQELLQ